MLRFSANLSFLYLEFAFTDRFAAAARDGFTAVEYASPYSEPKERLADLLAAHNLTQALFNLPAGNWGAGERGLTCRPDRVREFRDSLQTALDYAAALGCKQLNALAGIAPAGVDRAILEETMVANLRYAAPRCADSGIKLLTEPINTRDMPGFFLPTIEDAERILDKVGHDNLYIQYDIYHRQMMGGSALAGTFLHLRDRIAHVQIADAPGRHEPGTGTIDFDAILTAIDTSGYDGWVGCEYVPVKSASDGLGWREKWLSRD